MSAAKQFILAGALKYLTLILVPLITAFVYFKVYTVEESISYFLVALICVGVIFAVKFGKKTLDNEFPDKFKWIAKLIGKLLFTALAIGLLIAVKAYIHTVICLTIFVGIGELCAVPFVIWQNIAKLKDYEGAFGTKSIAEALKSFKGRDKS